MKKLFNLKISTRIIIGFSVVILLAILVGGIAFFSLMTMNSSMKSMYSNNLLPIRYLGEIRRDLLTIRGDVFRYIGTTHTSEYQTLEKSIANSFDSIKGPLASFKEAGLTEEEIELANKFEEHILYYEKDIKSGIEEHKSADPELALLLIENASINRERAIIILDRLVDMNTEAAEKGEILGRQTYEKSSMLMLVLLFICVVVSVGVTVIITASIKKPITEAEKMANSFAEGNLRERVNYEGKDELGKLMDSFNKTAASLQNVISEILKSSGAVTHASQQLSATMEETNASMQEISNGIAHIAETNENNIAEIEQISSAISDISNKANTTAESSKLAAETGNEVKISAEKGGELVQNVSNLIDTVRIASGEVSNIMIELERSANEINQAVELITGISEQTNLLSLNAAIEAARAGEQGRGFAVVADEVRKLAAQSKEATMRIEHMVNAIQTNCATAREKTADSDLLIKNSYTAANETNSYITNIIEKISTIVGQVYEIADDAAQQSLMTNEISSSINSIAENIESQASSSEQISATTQQQSSAIEEVGATAEELAGMAANLDGIVSRFKV